MSLRVHLRGPDGETVIRDVVDGRWAEPEGDAGETVGDGLWALPGLVDAHAHVASDSLTGPSDFDGAQARLRDSLDGGVTLILDKGWSDDTAIRAVRAVPVEERPEVEAAAAILAVDGGYYSGFGLAIEPDELGPASACQAGAGLGWVKVIGDWPRKGAGPLSNFDAGQLQAAVEAAEQAGARVAIHTMARDVPSQAVSAGVHSIEHGLFLEADDIGPLGERSGMWVPTVLRVEAIIEQLGAESSGGKLLREGLERLRRLLPLAVEAGVHVLAGTDLVGSPRDVAQEAIRLAGCGLSNRQVVAAVSEGARAAVGRDSSFALGEPADAAWFPENPVESLGVLAHPSRVMRLGRLI